MRKKGIPRESVLACVFLLIIIEILTVFLMYKSFSNKDTDLHSVKLKEQIVENDNLFAVLLQQTDGTYKESDEDFWSITGYNYNESMSGCMDMSGNKLDGSLEYDAVNEKITINTSKTAYCYLYFDLFESTVLSNSIISLTEVEDSGVYHETASGMKAAATYSVIPANASSWSSMTLGEGVTITSEAEGTYQLAVSCDDGGNCTPPSSTSTFKPLNSGYYKVFGAVEHIAYSIYVDDQQVYNYHPYSGEESGSRDLGYLTPENTIKIVHEALGGTENISFEILYAPSETVNLESYRYEGAEVNNYVTFNDETWRIIGVEEGSTIGLTSGEYYTKIIRSETLGDFAYDYGAFSDATEWRYTQPNNFLNLGYYNKQEYFDESFGTTIDAGFTTNGLTEESRGMITQPTWRGLYYDNVTTTSATYFYEKTSGSSSSGYVGLMSPSDYGYAALQSECASTQLTSYSSCASNNWLSGNSEWLIGNIEYDEENDAYNVLALYSGGNVVTQSSFSSKPYRPVVYLKSNVVITNDGTGAEGNKYEIALSE